MCSFYEREWSSLAGKGLSRILKNKGLIPMRFATNRLSLDTFCVIKRPPPAHRRLMGFKNPNSQGDC